MNIVDSDLGYLGYNGAEAYGVAYKARGCGIDTPNVCAVLNVRGKQTGSRFHDNFMGTYTWGAQDMLFDRNTYTKNKSYGLDPHDDSDYLTITNNVFSENNNHGLICSQRCDHLTIRGNKALNNGHTPYVGPGDDDPSDNQVHGIMLHRGITDTVVENNEVRGQINGGGIVVFDSVGNTVRNNTIAGNKYGLRFSVGTRDLVVADNTITESRHQRAVDLQGHRLPGVHRQQRPAEEHQVHRQHVPRGRRGAVQGPGQRQVHLHRRFDHPGRARPRAEVRARGRARLRPHRGHPGRDDVHPARHSSQPTDAMFRGMAASAVKVDKDAFSTATFTAASS